MLFVLSTQPLLDFFAAEIAAGRLQGIPIREGLIVSYKLFADDLGMFLPANREAFAQVRSILALYEVATGARINLSKSMVVPMEVTESLDWLREIGCQICAPG